MSKRFLSQLTDIESQSQPGKFTRREFSTQRVLKTDIMPMPAKAKGTRKYKKSVKSSAAIPAAIKTYVKKQIDKNVENKRYTSDQSGVVSGDGNLILTPSSSTLPQYYSLIPSISQGSTDFTRIGNHIKLVKAEVEVQMHLSGASVTAGTDVPMNIYWFILRVRDSPDTINAADLNQLFIANNAYTQYLSGSGYANCHKLNNDYFDIAATNYPNSPCKLGYAAYTSSLYTNNDYSSCIKFKVDYTDKCDKLIRFNNTTTTALTHNWYMCFYLQKQNLDTSTVNWDPPQAYVSHNILFEDA